MKKQDYAYICQCCGEWIHNANKNSHDARMASYREYQRGMRLKDLETLGKLIVDAERANLPATASTARECQRHLQDELDQMGG